MPGFFVSNLNSQFSLKDKYIGKYINEKINSSGFEGIAMRSTINKFLLDKTFEENEDLIVIIEGYLLNKMELFNLFEASNMFQLVINMISAYGDDFFKDFRGCFSGAVYIKKDNKWIVFTNQIGDNPIFYCQYKDVFAAGSQVQYLIDFCSENKINLTLNEDCIYQILTYGYVAGDDTYVNEIKRLHGGDYLIITNGEIQVKTYHRFESNQERLLDMNENEIVELIDKTFRHAVQLEWDKDDEYGYKHLADLSGGLDSRMNIWVAHEMKDRHLSLLTYSKAGELDEIISKEIALYWNDELIFKPLDDISFMFDIDDNTALLNGLSLYSGITGGKRLLEMLDLSEYGIEHTGMVGDISLGSFYHNDNERINRIPTGRYSEKLKSRLNERINNLPDNYTDYEIYLMYVRGFHGACNSHLLRRNYTEVGSPFLNVEFMQLCYDIPVKFRMNHYIYKKWICTKYPTATKFKWEKLGGKITENPIQSKMRIIIKRGPRKILKLLGYRPKDIHGMNPIDYWLQNNKVVSQYLDNYVNTSIDCLKKYYSETLLNDILYLYKSGNAWEKSMSLTVLSATKMYMGASINSEKS